MPLDLTQTKIMLVEDDSSMRALVKQLLYAFEVGRIDEFSNATEALREISASQPDIVICDWMMEPMDGVTFAREIRVLDDRHVRTVPIIMLTGFTERRRVEHARDSGVTEFLAKPVSAHAMYARLQAVIERPRSFVDVKGFHGPDRRRRNTPIPSEATDRRKSNRPASGEPDADTVFEISDDE